MKSYYGALHEMQFALAQEDLDADMKYLAHIQPLDTEYRRLNDQLAEKFKEPIQQFQDGLISTIELFDKLYYEAFTKPIEKDNTHAC